MFKTIIFDFDDTLFSSADYHVESFKKAVKKYDLRINEKEIVKLFGKPVIEILGCLFPHLPKSKLEKIKHEKEKNYKKMIQNNNPEPLDGVKNILDYLNKSNFNIGVLSSDSKSNIELILKKSKISNYFDKIIGSEDVQVHKPKPDGLLKIVKQMKSHVNECLYVGDSKYDMMAATRANIVGIGITTGHYSKTDLKSNGANMVFDSLEEMLLSMKSGKILN